MSESSINVTGRTYVHNFEKTLKECYKVLTMWPVSWKKTDLFDFTNSLIINKLLFYFIFLPVQFCRHFDNMTAK